MCHKDPLLVGPLLFIFCVNDIKTSKTVEQNINEEQHKLSGCLKVNKLYTKKMIICENRFEHNISLNMDNNNITRVSDFNILLGLMINHNLDWNKKCSRPIGILNTF